MDPETSSSWVFQELKPKPRKPRYKPPRRSSSRPCPRGPTDIHDTRSTDGSDTSRSDQGFNLNSFEVSEQGFGVTEQGFGVTEDGFGVPEKDCWDKDFPDSATKGVRPASEDSGVAWDSGLFTQTKDIDSFFGSVGDLTDEMFHDIFNQQPQQQQQQHLQQQHLQQQHLQQQQQLHPQQQLHYLPKQLQQQHQQAQSKAQDMHFRTIQEEEREYPVVCSSNLAPEISKPKPKPRTWIRTNPFVSWSPPDSVTRLRKVQVTEI
jgi:hypothetical protein